MQKTGNPLVPMAYDSVFYSLEAIVPSSAVPAPLTRRSACRAKNNFGVLRHRVLLSN